MYLTAAQLTALAAEIADGATIGSIAVHPNTGVATAYASTRSVIVAMVNRDGTFAMKNR